MLKKITRFEPLMSIILTLIIFVLTASLIFIYRNNYISDIEQYQEYIINRAESRKKNLVSTALQILSEKAVQTALYGDADNYELIEARYILHNKYIQYSNIEEIIIVDKKNNLVFTDINMSPIPFELYSNREYDFKSLYKKYLTTDLVYLSEKNNKNECQSFFVYNDYRNYIVFFRISDEEIKGFFDTELSFEQSTAVYYDMRLWCSSSRDSVFDLRDELYDLKESDIVPEQKNNMLISTKSDIFMCYTLINRLDLCIMIAKRVVGILFIIILMYFLLIWFIRKYTREVNRQLYYFPGIISAMQTSAKKQSMSMLISKLFFDMNLSGNEKNLFYEKSKSSVGYMSVLIKMNTKNEYDRGVDLDGKEGICQSFKEELGRFGKIEIKELKENTFGIIIYFYKEVETEQILCVYQKTADRLYKQYSVKFNMTFSDMLKDLNDLMIETPKLFERLELRYFYGDESIIRAGENDRHTIIPYPNETEKKILDLLSAADIDGAMKLIDKFKAYLLNATPFVARCYICVFITNAENFMRLMNYELESNDKYRVENSETLEEAVEEIKSISSFFIAQKKVNNKIYKENKLLKNIREVVAERYSDSDFSIADVAKILNLSPSYSGEKFKEYFGCSFSSYLLDYRLKVAKELLETTNYKISAIRKLCGFSADSYFNNVFKKNVGMTPNAYRTSKINHRGAEDDKT